MPSQGPSLTPKAQPKIKLPVTRLPFVGERSDGRFGYWVLPEVANQSEFRLKARTYAAWYLLYGEINGQQAARDLMDRIELEMPSRYPTIDRIFLQEIARSTGG